jgi:hypothetical protein
MICVETRHIPLFRFLSLLYNRMTRRRLFYCGMVQLQLSKGTH